jgi:hypothetical protein
MALRCPSWRVVFPCALGLALAPGRADAQAGAGAPRSEGIDLGRILAVAPEVLARVLERGPNAFFRLIEDFQVFQMEAEIDRYVGDPRDLNDSTEYKLSLLAFHIRYPIYRDLIDQMTRLDSLRSRRIHTVTPGSVRLLDLQIQPVETLEEFAGLGTSGEIQRSLLTHFTGREIADLGVFLLSLQPFFPETDEGWDLVKRRIARGTVPVAMGALAAGAAFDAGALSYSSNILKRGERLRLGWYGAFRELGVHLRPNLRGGLTLAAGGLEAAAGLADQIRPSRNQPDRALELALREGWLNQLARPLGWDVYIEGAVSQTIQQPAGFSGDATTTRGGFFFKRDLQPAFLDLVLRGSAEAESNLQDRVHLTTSLGLENSRSEVATMVQASSVPNSNGTHITDDRLTAFVAGTMESLATLFAKDMLRSARRVEIEWEGFLDVERRHTEWEQRLVAAGVSSRTPEEAQNDLRELARMIGEREDDLLRLAAALADYLQNRRRAYDILGFGRAPDNLHGPLDARVLVTARDRVFERMTALSKGIEEAPGRLDSLRARIAHLETEIGVIEARKADDPILATLRDRLATLERDWERETESVRHWLEAYDHFRTQAVRILTDGGHERRGLRKWDTLSPPVRRRAAWLAFSVRP